MKLSAVWNRKVQKQTLRKRYNLFWRNRGFPSLDQLCRHNPITTILLCSTVIMTFTNLVQISRDSNLQHIMEFQVRVSQILLLHLLLHRQRKVNWVRTTCGVHALISVDSSLKVKVCEREWTSAFGLIPSFRSMLWFALKMRVSSSSSIRTNRSMHRCSFCWMSCFDDNPCCWGSHWNRWVSFSRLWVPTYQNHRRVRKL